MAAEDPLRLIISLTLFAALAAADEASKRQKIEQLLVLTNSASMMDQMFDQLRGAIAQQRDMLNLSKEDSREMTNEIETVSFAMLRERLSWDKLRPKFIDLYAETFTEEEVEGMVAFYRSPAGKAAIEKMPKLVGQSMAITNEMMKDVLPEMMQRTEAIVVKYRNRALEQRKKQ
jgi:hypothetical protein